jgi:alpha-amylase
MLRILTRTSDTFSRIYVDVVFNHMTGDHPNAIGVGGTPANTYNKHYPGVPYGSGDFHPTCDIDYQNPVTVSDPGL